MIVLVCGLSKSGKTSLIAAARAEGLECTVTKGSTLLRNSGREITRLSVADALANQPILLGALARIEGDKREIHVFDGHLLIETVDGPLLVPDAAFANLPLGGVVHVIADVDTLSRRREGSGFTTDRQELGDLTTIEAAHSRRLARKHGVRHFEIHNADVVGFMNAAASCLDS